MSPCPCPMVLEADERAARVAELLAKKQAEQRERDAVKRRLQEDAVRVSGSLAVACRTGPDRTHLPFLCALATRRSAASGSAGRRP